MARTPDKTTSEVIEQVRRVGTETGLLFEKKWTELAHELNHRGIQTSRGKTWTGTTLRIFAERQGLIVTQEPHTVLEHEGLGPVDRDVTQLQDTDTQPQGSGGITHQSDIVSHPEPSRAITQMQDRVPHQESPEGITQRQDGVTQPESQYSVPQAHTTDDAQAEVLQLPTFSHVPKVQEAVIPSHTLDFNTIQGLRDMLSWWRSRKDDLMPKPIEERPLFKRVPSTTRSVRIGADLALDAERYALKHRAETGGSFSGLVELLLWERLGRRHKYLQPVPQANTQSDNAMNDAEEP